MPHLTASKRIVRVKPSTKQWRPFLMQHAASDSITELFPALEWTGERYLPWVRNATMAYEHVHRYGFAARFAKGKRVLDLGSGEGYGSNIMAAHASYVLGVDIDPACIQHASLK